MSREKCVRCPRGMMTGKARAPGRFSMPPTLQELGLDRLSVEDRIALAEALWDSVAREVEQAPLTPAQRQELERRLADSIARPDAVTPWEEIKARAIREPRIYLSGREENRE